METLERYLDAGATRLVLGSALVRDPAFCEAAVAAHADNIVAGIDAKDGMVAIEGWREGTSTPAVDLVAELKDRGIHELVYTDIARDGMQTGIDAAAYGRLAQVAGFPDHGVRWRCHAGGHLRRSESVAGGQHRRRHHRTRHLRGRVHASKTASRVCRQATEAKGEYDADEARDPLPGREGRARREGRELREPARCG